MSQQSEARPELNQNLSNKNVGLSSSSSSKPSSKLQNGGAF